TEKVYIGDFAVVTRSRDVGSDGTLRTEYLHRDHLGSVDTITDEAGVVIQRMSFDAWGKRREVNWQVMMDAAIMVFDTGTTTRGFTGHEMLDPVGLVHMNGRIYDPELGRFLSADPNVQETDNLQNWNRYSYVLNNPLSYTDPTGFFFKSLFRAIGQAFGKIFSAIGRAFKKLLSNPIVRAAIQIAACISLPVAGCAAASATMPLAGGGSITDALKAAAFAFVSHGIWQGVDGVWGGLSKAISGFSKLGKSLVHGVVGGAMSVARGGNFLVGFATGALGKATSFVSDTISQGNQFLDTLIVAASGCGASVIAGGKCANGAVTAAFANMYNKWGAAARLRSRWINNRISISKSVDDGEHTIFKYRGEHRYVISGEICSVSTSGCNSALADKVFDYVNKNDVPFSSNDLGGGFKNLIDGLFRPLGNQPIDHVEYPDIRTAINTTLEGHNFHPGTVTHSVRFSDSSLLYNVTGQGSGRLPGFNNNLGVSLFKPNVRDVVNRFGR
ncbi:MAG: RHS repeat-associated core domain-containing protein, partial [Pseudomonadota bacterium]